MEVFRNFDLCIFDPFGNFHFLLAGEQRDLAHLFEIHADGIVEDVELLVCLDLFLVAVAFITLLVFEPIDLRGVDDVELHVAEALHDRLDVIGIDEVVGEDLVDVIVGEIFLLLSEFDKLTDFLLDLRGVDAAFLALVGLLPFWCRSDCLFGRLRLL